MFRQIGIAVLAGLVATGALASDLDIINAPEIDISGSTVSEGWYLRGDLGYSGWMKGGKPDYKVYQPGGTVFSNESFDSARFSKPLSYGAGMGYRFNNFLRTDLTTDFFNGSLSGKSNINAPCSADEPAGTSCGFSHNADYNAVNFMANGYVDLGTYAGITPYFGAGAGVTYVRWSDMVSRPFCEDGSSACSGTTYENGRLKGEDSWRFTYALMAGASVDLTNRIKLDLGYRYSDTAGGKMFQYGATERGWGASGAKGRDDGFQKHEIRAGIRVTTW
jgi:opacity protein-like surface antigen